MTVSFWIGHWINSCFLFQDLEPFLPEDQLIFACQLVSAPVQ
jgi:hypothetical protein